MDLWLNINLTLTVVALFGVAIGRLIEIKNDFFTVPVVLALLALASWPVYLLVKIW